LLVVGNSNSNLHPASLNAVTCRLIPVPRCDGSRGVLVVTVGQGVCKG